MALVDSESIVIQLSQIVLVTVDEVSDELVKIDKLQQQFNLIQQRVVTLYAAIKNANLLFKNGMATYQEVISAQSNSLQSELELARLKAA